MTVKSWKDIAAAKRAEVRASIPTQWIKESLKDDMKQAEYCNTCDYLDTIVPASELAVTKLTMLDLQEKISTGQLTAVQVTTAFCHRAALAHQILNCCSEIFFDKAMETAEYLDKYFAESGGKVIGPLHGIPISLKDQVDLPGMDSSIGYVAYLNKPKSEISLLAEHLKKSGAIFYVKTTVPMAMLAPETISNAYGYTYNALNINLTSGGSSGGEGALIGAGASPMGFGTDIGGSIRIPASFQGLHALKPSSGRISYLRVTNSYSGQETMPSVIGPMARSLADVEYITKLIIEWELWKYDPKVHPIPLLDNTNLKLSKLTLGIWKFDGSLTTHPPIQRALNQIMDALTSQGHEVIEIDLPNHEEILDTATKIFTSDQGKEVMETCNLSGEPVVPNVADLITVDPHHQPLDVNRWWDLCNVHYKTKENFNKFWNDTISKTKTGKPIDAIICPIWPSTSFVPGTANTLNYSCPFNVFNSSSVVLPVARVNKDIDLIQSDFVPCNELDKKIQESYDPELFDGMPVCVQVVGRTLLEEKTLAVASVVESSITS